jgi:CRP/FNR family transcriptional regulator
MNEDNIPFKDPALAAEFAHHAVRRSYTDGTVLMRPGDPITHIPIVITGTIRILAQGPDGGERYLYHIFPGESCAMSLTCCRTTRTSNVKAVIEEDARLWMVPVTMVDAWMRFPEWSAFVNDTQATRFSELLEAFEMVAFNRLDEQLWDYLLKRVQATGTARLKLTHQAIASELGSPREVITRLLHQLQQRGRVTLGRNEVEVHILAA